MKIRIALGLAVVALGLPLAGTASARCAPGHEVVCFVATTACNVIGEVRPPGCAV